MLLLLLRPPKVHAAPRPWSGPVAAVVFFGVGLYAGAFQAGIGLLMVLAAPATRLDVGASSLLVVPALAAALVAHLRSFVGAALAGLGIGMVQSELMNVQVEWAWLPDVGIQQGVPLLVILAVLAFWGDVLPQRGVVLSM